MEMYLYVHSKSNLKLSAIASVFLMTSVNNIQFKFGDIIKSSEVMQYGKSIPL